MVPLGWPEASGCRTAGKSTIRICISPVLPPSPQWLPHLPPAAWEIFPMEACPSPPCFNKSLEEGQGIPPGSSYTSQPVPHLLFPPSLARPGRTAGSQVLAEGGEGAQPVPRPAASSPFILTGKQGASAGGECPAACDPGTDEEFLDPAATLWSGGWRTASHRPTQEQFLIYVGMASPSRKQLQTKLELGGHAL